MIRVTTDLNEFNTLVGSFWGRADTDTIRIWASQMGMHALGRRSIIQVLGWNGWKQPVRASFPPTNCPGLTCIVLELRIADLRAACRALTKAAKARKDLGAYESVKIELSGADMRVSCCGETRQLTGRSIDSVAAATAVNEAQP